MDWMAILTLISKGLAIVEAAHAAGLEATPAIKVLHNLIAGAQAGKITEQELAEIETLLDSQLEEFNKPIG